MTKEELERIKGLSVGLALQPKWWALITNLESAWAERDAEKAGTMSKIGEIVRLRKERGEAVVEGQRLSFVNAGMQLEIERLKTEIERYKRALAYAQ
jgi:hypothetical protein